MAMILPSTQWGKAVGRLWAVMSTNERRLSLAALILPTLNKIAILGSFGLAVKLILASARGDIPLQWRWSIALGIGAAFTLSGLIRWAGDKNSIALDSSSLRIARRIMAENLLKARGLLKEERREVTKNFRKVEAGIVKKWSSIIIDIVDLVSSFVTIAILIPLIIWVLPLVGVFMMVGGSIMLCYFCFRIKKSKEAPPLHQAKNDLNKLVKRLASGNENPQIIIKKYENNRVDKIRSKHSRQSRTLKGKLSWLVSGGAAIMMAAVFYLASDGWLEGKDPVLLLLFAFALRFSILQSEKVFFKWTLLLRERDAARVLHRVLRGDAGFIGSGNFTINSAAIDATVERDDAI